MFEGVGPNLLTSAIVLQVPEGQVPLMQGPVWSDKAQRLGTEIDAHLGA